MTGGAGVSGRAAASPTRALWRTLKDRLTSAAYGLGWSAVCRMPESWAKSAFDAVADIAWRRQGPRVQVLEGNLRRVLGPDADGAELRELSREGMRSYARYWMEMFRLPVMPVEQVVRDTVATGEVKKALAVLAAGRGVIFALPHMGNYDQAAVWIMAQTAGASTVGSFTTVQERLRPESLYDRFVAFREGLGMEVLPASGGVVRAFGTLAERLRAGKLVCLVADRDVTGSGTEVEFFGEQARMMGGSAALAERTGAALFPAILWYDGDRWGIHVDDEIVVPSEGDRKQKVAAMTQELARCFEAGIREHPADWHMVQRVFVADLDQARLARADAAAAVEAADVPQRPGTGEAVGEP
jgi:phosphatidylinositol dimannoside acyltransferase